MLHKNIQNIPSFFYCEKCDYKCSKQSVFNQHLNTAKHKNATSMLQNICPKNVCQSNNQKNRQGNINREVGKSFVVSILILLFIYKQKY
jgi:hypothetical protein